jgi:hypothetical protein
MRSKLRLFCSSWLGALVAVGLLAPPASARLSRDFVAPREDFVRVPFGLNPQSVFPNPQWVAGEARPMSSAQSADCPSPPSHAIRGAVTLHFSLATRHLLLRISPSPPPAGSIPPFPPCPRAFVAPCLMLCADG